MPKRKKHGTPKIIIPTFTTGIVYAVKALDHFSFTRNDISNQTKLVFFNFVGVYIEDSPMYHIFKSFEYSDEADDTEIQLAPQKTFILKNTITNYKAFTLDQ